MQTVLLYLQFEALERPERLPLTNLDVHAASPWVTVANAPRSRKFPCGRHLNPSPRPFRSRSSAFSWAWFIPPRENRPASPQGLPEGVMPEGVMPEGVMGQEASG